MANNPPGVAGRKKERRLGGMYIFIYDALLWVFSIIIDLFFRELHPRGSWRIPRKGAILFVAAPHANQFVDPLILMRVVRKEAKRRINFLIAEKSMRRRFIGKMAALVGAVPVGRALDSTIPAPGKIYLPDPDNDPLVVRGVGTNFEAKEFQIGGLLVLPKVNQAAGNAEIAQILGPEEIRLKKPFGGRTAVNQLTGRERVVPDGMTEDQIPSKFEGTSFDVAPKIDQSKVYDAVFDRLNDGGCVGIFPEGGSHDRTELLPLKPGVALMALGALAKGSDVKIVPCGMNYFHAHKFRSRAVVEFGAPIEIPQELVELYKAGERREAVGRLLNIVFDCLRTVTVTAPSYDTLMLIQAVRRLYRPKGKKLPLPMVIELNRRLAKAYEKFKDDPRIAELQKAVLAYNKRLLQLQIRDHQVEYAKLPFLKVLILLMYRLLTLVALSVAVLPGLILFSPVFVAGKLISVKKSKEALAASSVKIQARDVVATWKLLVSLALAPALYILYAVILGVWTYKNHIQGIIHESIPPWAVSLLSLPIFAFISYGGLRFGEIGMDIVKSLRPLFVAASPRQGNLLHQLRARRERLVVHVNELINELGPEVFPDFDATRLIADPYGEQGEGYGPGAESFTPHEGEQVVELSEPPSPSSPSYHTAHPPPDSHGGLLPRNESFKNISGFGIFASRPVTPHHPRSRSRTNSGPGIPVQAFTSLDHKQHADAVSTGIQGAMRRRLERRASESEEFDSGDESESEGEGEEMVMGRKDE